MHEHADSTILIDSFHPFVSDVVVLCQNEWIYRQARQHLVAPPLFGVTIFRWQDPQWGYYTQRIGLKSLHISETV